MATWKKIAYHDDVIAKSLVTTKGDLIVATGSATPARLAVGSNDQVLTADSAQAAGVKWAAAGGGGATLTVAETEVYSANAPTSWTDLDLSGTVGSNAALVVIKIIGGTLGAVAVRKNGDTDEFHSGTEDLSSAACALARVESSGVAKVFLVATDDSGVIEWKGEVAQACTVDIIAYIV